MNLNFIPVNGKCEYFNYDEFESSVRTSLQNTCKEATVILFNNFPVLLSTETTVDLILVIALKDYKGNYFRVRKGDKWVYLYNLIIPINFITNLQESEIQIDEEGFINADGEQLDYSDEIQSIKHSLLDYLVRKCNFIKEQLYINPLIHIKNKSTLTIDNFLVSEKFDFNNLLTYLKSSTQDIFCSYKNWKTETGYSILPTDIESINNQASKDSVVGYLTKKKIDRISKQLSNEKAIFGDLNKHLIFVQGKAGTGKSSELLLLMMRCITNGQNTLFLTYNRLLIYDIARTTKSFVNSQRARKQEHEKIGQASVITLHSFFYRLSKSVGVLHVLTDKRKNELLSNLDLRTNAVKNFILSLLNEKTASSYSEYENLKEQIQNNKQFDIPTIEVGIDFMNYQKKRGYLGSTNIEEAVKSFIKFKTDLVNNIDVKEVFLSDYYGVLDNTLLLINRPEEYFKKHQIENKFELLEVVLNLSEKHRKKDEEKNLIDEQAFRKNINKRVGGRKRKRTIFIDEAQDCHAKEKEILIAIFGSDNVVVSSGGKEQLIRHIELCNWEVSNQRIISVKKYQTGNKSFRIKKSILNFCNFVAAKYQIELKLEPLETEDNGELILDFRNNVSDSDMQQIFSNLSMKGKISSCTPYESLLVMIDSHSKIDKSGNKGTSTSADAPLIKGKINEYDNIEDSHNIKKIEWRYKKPLEKENDLMFWDGTETNKSQLEVPYPTETRLIYYDSCRGLEAWTVACFNIDKFFEQKREDPDAEKFLINDEKELGIQSLFVTNDSRKDMFAGTWALMAITRAIDTLYLKLDNPYSEFSKLLLEYAKLNPTTTKVFQ
jgi:hypothetical protein